MQMPQPATVCHHSVQQAAASSQWPAELTQPPHTGNAQYTMQYATHKLCLNYTPHHNMQYCTACRPHSKECSKLAACHTSCHTICTPHSTQLLLNYHKVTSSTATTCPLACVLGISSTSVHAAGLQTNTSYSVPVKPTDGGSSPAPVKSIKLQRPPYHPTVVSRLCQTVSTAVTVVQSSSQGNTLLLTAAVSNVQTRL